MLGVAPNITAYASAKENRESLKNALLFSVAMATQLWWARWNEALEVPFSVALRKKSQ
jgi:hypothetical protein